MKQFVLKNIVLIVVLVLTLIGSVVLISLILQKRATIKAAMNEIKEKRDQMEEVMRKSKPNSVKESETLIKADTDTVKKKVDLVYRHFGKPYRPALLNFLTNIASKSELKTDLPVDESLLNPGPRPAKEDEDEDVEEEEEVKVAEPSSPTKEEKAVFDPAKNLVVLTFDEDMLHDRN